MVPTRARAADRVDNAIAGSKVRESEAALVAQPALRPPRGGCARRFASPSPRAWSTRCCSRPGRGRRRSGRPGSPRGGPRSGTGWRSAPRPGRARSRCPRTVPGTARPRRWRSPTASRGRARRAGCPRRRRRRTACSGSRGCSARGRARSSARSGSASRRCASGRCFGSPAGPSGRSGPGAGTRRPCHRPGSRVGG